MENSIWQKLKSQTPILAMAPMEGYTDSAMRRTVKTLVPNLVSYTEFTSADAIKYNSEKSKKKLFFVEEERPLIVQLFGKNIENFIEAAKWVEQQGADGLDINMGCPAKNVVASEHGAAMIKNPNHAAELVHTLSKHTKLPLSVKTRVGFSSAEPEHFFSFTDKLIAAGAQAIAVHGRTSKQGYTGEADWSFVYELKKRHPEIFVIGNGDIKNGEIAKNKIQNLDGVMVGRAVIGNPWIMKEIAAALRGETFDISTISFPDKVPTILNHAQFLIDAKGTKVAMLEIRKHLASYIKALPNAGEYRSRLVQVHSFQEVESIIHDILKEQFS
jgi:nifR3 family TIM-barrel protein